MKDVSIPWPSFRDCREDDLTREFLDALVTLSATIPPQAIVVAPEQAKRIEETGLLQRGEHEERKTVSVKKERPADVKKALTLEVDRLASLEARMSVVEDPEEETEVTTTTALPSGSIGWLGPFPVFVVEG